MSQKLPHFVNAAGKPIKNVCILAPYTECEKLAHSYISIDTKHYIESSGKNIVGYDEYRNLIYSIHSNVPHNFGQTLFTSHIDKILILDIEREHFESQWTNFYEIIKKSGVSFMFVKLIYLGDVLDTLAKV